MDAAAAVVVVVVVVVVAAGTAIVATVAALASEFTIEAIILVSGHEGTHWRSGGVLALACCKPLLLGNPWD